MATNAGCASEEAEEVETGIEETPCRAVEGIVVFTLALVLVVLVLADVAAGAEAGAAGSLWCTTFCPRAASCWAVTRPNVDQNLSLVPSKMLPPSWLGCTVPSLVRSKKRRFSDVGWINILPASCFTPGK